MGAQAPYLSMPDNIKNIRIPRGEWLDLYFASGIPVGTAIAVENVGDCDVYLAVQQDQPSPDHDAYNILVRDKEILRNTDGDPGAWAFCQCKSCKVQVREAI